MASRGRRSVAALAIVTAAVAVPGAPGAAQATCFGEPVTITAQPAVGDEVVETIGTSGPDVIMGTNGRDNIRGRGGRDLICSLGGDDYVHGGSARDKIDLGPGNDRGLGGTADDLIRGRSGRDQISGNEGEDELVGGPGNDELFGGRHRDEIRGNSGDDVIEGDKGRDDLDGGTGDDTCRGGTANDTGTACETVYSLTEDVTDTFGGNGDLIGYTTNNPGSLPDVDRTNGRYRANLTNNSSNITLHFNSAQGRLDARLVEFPFDITVRNIGIGTQADSQSAPVPSGSPYIFAGVQVHVPNLDDRNSSHIVVGHRGGDYYTVEGKNTVNGSSSVDDEGFNAAPDGRADIRVVGNENRTLTIYWQTPNPNPGGQADNWALYRGTGSLPGSAPDYPKSVYFGLITYAQGSNGVPFVGTADGIEITPAS